MSVLSVYTGPDGYSRNGTIYISNSVSIVWRKLLIEKSKLKVGQYYFDIGFGDDPFFTDVYKRQILLMGSRKKNSLRLKWRSLESLV